MRIGRFCGDISHVLVPEGFSAFLSPFRVYDNVDRDEDDEIDILELDFALKAVNYDLISDSELTYVNSVLELAGRHKLNFRYFSLIAALSEKVVALE